VTDPRANPITEALNTLPKNVVSATLKDPDWVDTTVLTDDFASAVRELRAQPDRELQVLCAPGIVRPARLVRHVRIARARSAASSAMARVS
jgi:hypothetical protein